VIGYNEFTESKHIQLICELIIIDRNDKILSFR